MSTPSAPTKRSHAGCWTCKKRRRKCDEARPTCNACAKANVPCQGYGSRLKWGSGVASRGYLTGANTPNLADALSRPKGRKRDRDKQSIDEQHIPVKAAHAESGSTAHSSGNRGAPPSPVLSGTIESPLFDPEHLRDLQKETLFQKFLASGFRSLHASLEEDARLLSILPALRERSDTLFDVCVACQARLSRGADATFYDYYDEALASFRGDLHDPARQYDDATLIAALLLCTIGMLQGTPWTIHLEGMAKLLEARSEQSPPLEPSPNFIQAVEVMGVMDLDIFVVGRQFPRRNIWKHFRLERRVSSLDKSDSIETMSGLPRSLIDLLANMESSSAEEDLWLWPGCSGTLSQCQLWEAHRFAAILDLRKNLTGKARPSLQEQRVANEAYTRTPPSDDIIVNRALSSIDAIHNGASKPSAANSLVMNAVLWPLFVLSLEILRHDKYSQWHSLIEYWFEHEVKSSPFAMPKLAWDLVQGVINKYHDGLEVTAEEVALQEGLEIGLL